MDFGELVFLNASFYEKDGQPRCYARFAKLNDGEVISFDARVWRQSDRPNPFSLCHVTGQLRQYGNSASFILENCDIVGQMEVVG